LATFLKEIFKTVFFKYPPSDLHYLELIKKAKNLQEAFSKSTESTA
jgi:hypothetical protein